MTTADFLKIFFDSIQNKGEWWPLKREARNVAVLEKIQAGLRRSSPKPVHVPAKRTTRLDCLGCLYAFSDDGCRSQAFDALCADERVAISDSYTRIRRCFGWTRVRGADFIAMNKVIEIDRRAEEKGEGCANYIEHDREYFAIVYEYIPAAKLEYDALKRQLNFYYIGFQQCQGANRKDWQGPGILLDFGDYNSPVDSWFKGGAPTGPALLLRFS